MGLKAEDIVSTVDSVRYTLCWKGERVPICLTMPGEHNVANSMAVIAIARRMGLSYQEIQGGLEQVSLSKLRMEIGTTKQGAVLINDCYNANPEAMAGALEVLSHYSDRRRIAVLGDMYELGQYSEQGHKFVGEKVVATECELLITVGALAKHLAQVAINAGMDSKQIRL